MHEPSQTGILAQILMGQFNQTTILITSVLFVAAGGWISRIIGGGWPSTYIPIPMQWIYAIPYGLILCPQEHVISYILPLVAYVAAAIGKRTAVYPYDTLGTLSPIDTTRVPPLDFLLPGSISATGGQFWRDAAGLALTGVAMTIVPGILYGCFNDHLIGLVIALSGALKSVAYILELLAFKCAIIKSQSVLGEILNGVFCWGVLIGIH